MAEVSLITLVPPRGRQNPWLKECIASAAGQGRHVLVDVPNGGFFESRRNTYLMGGLVGCLDYDDRIVSGAAGACAAALARTGAGVAFTWQARIDESGARIREDRRPVPRRHLALVPDSVHHLSVIRSDLLPADLFDLVGKVAPLCVDWVVKAYLALRFGAVQVPMVGYEWRMHPGQTTRSRGEEWAAQIPLARSLIKTWSPLDTSALETFAVDGRH